MIIVQHSPPLMQPKGMHIAIKFQWFVEWPFSLLRWLTVPHCYHVSNNTFLLCGKNCDHCYNIA